MFELRLFTQKKWIATLGLGAGLALSPIGASALTINAGDLTAGTNAVDLGFAKVNASPDNFAHKSVAGYDVVGVHGGYEYGEIDLARESIGIMFTEATVVSDLSLGLLFVRGEHEDVLVEVAGVDVVFADGTTGSYSLQVLDGLTASWNGSTTGVTNLSPALFGGAGVFSVANPFGDAAVKSISLIGQGLASPLDYRNSDYGFVSLSGTPVPEPGTVSLISLGLGGLGFAGRKRRN
jgi:hypothetical protein